ncbi:hypothetical protein O1M63_04065 [Streptomyces mirabilis]|nr:hypothetical protein [Streptomyces mirabilis]
MFIALSMSDCVTGLDDFAPVPPLPEGLHPVSARATVTAPTATVNAVLRRVLMVLLSVEGKESPDRAAQDVELECGSLGTESPAAYRVPETRSKEIRGASTCAGSDGRFATGRGACQRLLAGVAAVQAAILRESEALVTTRKQMTRSELKAGVVRGAQEPSRPGA